MEEKKHKRLMNILRDAGIKITKEIEEKDYSYFSDDPYDKLLSVQVQRKPCLIVTVRVLRGRDISNGLLDYLDTPDPYVKLHMINMHNSPAKMKMTTTKDNNPNPVWEEEFLFYVNGTKINTLDITLMESNAWPLPDQDKGSHYFNVDYIKPGQPQIETFTFNNTSEIDIEFSCQEDPKPALRYSLCLSDAEKQFQIRRKEKVYQAMRRLLGEDGPKNINEVPTIAVIGSGGGFRAMTGYSGVFKALVESEILDCTMYTGGLLGSSWFLSTLYSHPKWPDLDMGEFLDELMNSVDKSLFRFLNLNTVSKYIDILWKKRNGGQPISFTDVFGRLVGETLIQERMDATLSDQRHKLEDGSVPMPLYTCVHVKEDVDAKSFQEWVEFSPYEIGMAEYGTFMDTKLFGSKFFMGKLLKKFDEPPLHFLQGIWGNAFSSLKKAEKELDNPSHESSSDCSDDDDEHEETDGTLESDTSVMEGNCTANEILEESASLGALHEQDANQKDGQETFARESRANSRMKKSKIPPMMRYLKSTLKEFAISQSWTTLSTHRYRASDIHNFMRGLSLEKSYPLSPLPLVNESVKEGDDGTDMVSTTRKKMYMVDAGLTFNSPYPLILRPQREVDIILSFDFTARESDKHEPFKELLQAEKWAKENIFPFPPIEVSKYIEEDTKELYIFKHPTDPYCPVVFHFALVNNKFRDYSKPGVLRQTKEELDFAKFDIFDDPNKPYSTFSFTYDHQTFKRLSQLTEFNTLLNVDEIKREMITAVRKKRDHPSRFFQLWQMHTVRELRKQKSPKSMHHQGDSGSNTPLFTDSSTLGSPSTNPIFTGSNQEVSQADGSDFTQVKSPTKTGWSSEGLTVQEKRAHFLSCNNVCGTTSSGIDLESNSKSSLQSATEPSDDDQSQ